MLHRICALVLVLGLAACSSNDDGDDGGAAGTTATTAAPADEAQIDDEGDPAEWDLPDEFTPVLGRFIGEETAPVLGSDGRYHVVYELWLTNGRRVPASLERIEVIDRDTDQVVEMLAGEDLLATAHELSTAPAGAVDLDPNESKMLLLALAFDAEDEVPDRLVHRLVGTGADSPGAQEPQPIDYLFAPWNISRRTTPVIGAPLAGEGWVVINGCCAARGAHRGAVQTVNGTLLNSQRFAIDWMRIDDQGGFIGDGDPSDPASWNAYGADVLAVADGTVVKVLDGLEDQKPGALPDPASITLETVDGNHVIIDLGGGLFVFYAHFKPGSIQVEEGDEVSAGQVIAQLGNTGNSSAPHLHIHLMNRASSIASDSIPFELDELAITGRVDPDEWYGGDGREEVPLTGAFSVLDTDAPQNLTAILPLDLTVVTFRGAEVR